MKNYNHPKHLRYWQQHVNELMGLGEYGLSSPSSILEFQRELHAAAMDARRASEQFHGMAEGRLLEDRTRLLRKSQMWLSWSKQLRSWIHELNSFLCSRNSCG